MVRPKTKTKVLIQLFGNEHPRQNIVHSINYNLQYDAVANFNDGRQASIDIQNI